MRDLASLGPRTFVLSALSLRASFVRTLVSAGIGDRRGTVVTLNNTTVSGQGACLT